MVWTSERVSEILGKPLLGHSQEVFGAAIDSRRIKGGEIFFALPGEKVDGNDYIVQAWEKSAGLAIGEKDKWLEKNPQNFVPADKGLILVESVLESMHLLAQEWGREIRAKVVAVTGSNGKTTTKDMIAAVLSQKYNVHKNQENFNNEIGLPLTILSAPVKTEVLVLEMGMRGLGQIKFLCDTASPDIGVITNIGSTHLELLGSQENIAQAKWELIESLKSQGIAILNAEDFWSWEKAKKLNNELKTIFYGIKGKYVKPDLQGLNLKSEGVKGTNFEVSFNEENVKVLLPLPGEHNVLDALAALAVGVSLGVPLTNGAQGLKDLELSKMRLEIKEGVYSSTLISDVYNANPASMKASLNILGERSIDKSLAILGEMYELGAVEKSGHQEVGEEVAALGIARLITVGKLGEEIAKGAVAKGMNIDCIKICQNREEAVVEARKILNNFESGGWVLIKGSRGMKMEEVTNALLK